ncbi:bifunctional coenzyme A synthase [Thecamonas trahens ATCC 50062]|uniref:Bifunctional coenzyme A synthase n=1 Tax=Thecamonas trahens ATCC 50062 TaxID=461836 RepID=A0A0L0DQN9_THETB|nr:bifunctional coenzyme A synthase [Thecamonas trahens ATCC 50062]KNC53753.1 bifunctional coenzyme A synthase [Thecamonas trahens ATCC 50062]|eukprot:XP_013754316.1 bifunctional coenzyme A synthase [Thecamonas trahens ATCC 50062]
MLRLHSMAGHVLVGGTFDRLHRGHRLLLDAAAEAAAAQAEATTLVVGVTADKMLVQKAYAELIEPFDRRAGAVRAHLADALEAKGGAAAESIAVDLVPLDDPAGPAGSLAKIDVLVVSEEPGVLKNVAGIRELRATRGLDPNFDVVVVEMVDEDGRKVDEASKVSSSELRRREAEAVASGVENVGQ